jgi:hypothetical protein
MREKRQVHYGIANMDQKFCSALEKVFIFYFYFYFILFYLFIYFILLFYYYYFILKSLRDLPNYSLLAIEPLHRCLLTKQNNKTAKANLLSLIFPIFWYI